MIHEVYTVFIAFLFVLQEVDGKHIQIQLTGFMEKNTIKFMKELWSLLLSAQQNASGVPQQFLDAKEAEIQQRKVCIKYFTLLLLIYVWHTSAMLFSVNSYNP
jgi:hypothetical protein